MNEHYNHIIVVLDRYRNTALKLNSLSSCFCSEVEASVFPSNQAIRVAFCSLQGDFALVVFMVWVCAYIPVLRWCVSSSLVWVDEDCLVCL